jgi:CRISPR-associated endonuclease/helicase Cas3
VTPLAPEQFAEFYQAVYRYDPFPWQARLAARVCAGGWPKVLALPTAAGKTTSLDFAVFALAAGSPHARRRVCFVVDRRVVVDQAYDHARKLAGTLRAATAGIVKSVADNLRELAGDDRPLDVYPLRGGLYRESAWTRSPLQPTVLTSTVDQVGSRLLFRGYGVSDGMKPVHAGLLGTDCLILLDEAHCARPFAQTMAAVGRYQSKDWSPEPTPRPLTFVEVSATPSDPTEADRFEIDDEDRANPVLKKRLEASKLAMLVVADRATGKNGDAELVKVLVAQAKELGRNGPVGVIVNRVKTARAVAAALDGAVLLTGRMRPVDRDRLNDGRLKALLSNSAESAPPPPFVVATQCIEVGADYDFHALVTECASLDALRQRFGRLNRVGNRPEAKAAVVIRGDQTDDTADDPVYGESLAETWKWLKQHAPTDAFDFGIDAVRAKLDGLTDAERQRLSPKPVDAAVLFPAHLDCWVQTSPIPEPDPDPAVFLRGGGERAADVKVVFRSDLGDDPELWADIVALCPPSSAEAVPVRIGDMKRWLAGDPLTDSADVEGEADETPADPPTPRPALRWTGPRDSGLVSADNRVRPGDTLVVPVSPDARGLGDFPGPADEPPTDVAEGAFLRSRDKAILRLPGVPQQGDDEDAGEFESRVTAAVGERLDRPSYTGWPPRAREWLSDPRQRRVVEHPGGGLVVTTRRRLNHITDPLSLEDTEPEESAVGKAVKLEDHSEGVAAFAAKFAAGCGLGAGLYHWAGRFHDAGKLDPRFQAMLLNRSPLTAVGQAWAKSGRPYGTRAEREAARKVHRYPSGARHELLSVALLTRHTTDDLALYLIQSHHGSARPLADPVEENDAAGPLAAELFGLRLSGDATQDVAAWNAHLPERFWRLVRRYGWWGLAYREAVFRTADQAQSAAEQEAEPSGPPPLPDDVPGWRPPPAAPAEPLHPLPLPGLDGSNPLGFLAALGTLRVLDRIPPADRPAWLGHGPRLSWGANATPSAVLWLAAAVDRDELLGVLAGQLVTDIARHPCQAAVQRCPKPDRPFRRDEFDWWSALRAGAEAEATSQLLVVRADYLEGNVKSVLSRCTADHLRRSLFDPWDYADALNNQSLHWEPSEDRRHAYQWYMPNGDPGRKVRGGMLGANRLALEAWPLFLSVPAGDRVRTRGFRGVRASDTAWTWPLWCQPLALDAVVSLLCLPALGVVAVEPSAAGYGVAAAYRTQRILVQKTPNLTMPERVL